jgi:hypothetical protein
VSGTDRLLLYVYMLAVIILLGVAAKVKRDSVDDMRDRAHLVCANYADWRKSHAFIDHDLEAQCVGMIPSISEDQRVLCASYAQWRALVPNVGPIPSMDKACEGLVDAH